MNEITDKELERYKRIEEVAYNVLDSEYLIPRNDLIEALKPIEPELYCGLTEDEWQRVIDGGYDVMINDGYQTKVKLTGFTKGMTDARFVSFEYGSSKYCEVVREIGHIQPHFQRLSKPGIPDDAMVITYKANYGWTPNGLAKDVRWSKVELFIQLTEGTKK